MSINKEYFDENIYLTFPQPVRPIQQTLGHLSKLAAQTWPLEGRVEMHRYYSILGRLSALLVRRGQRLLQGLRGLDMSLCL
jgi:hypothetical protein